MKKLLLALALCSMAIPSFGDDFSESINKDLGQQCFWKLRATALIQYDIFLNSFESYPAQRVSEKIDDGLIAVAWKPLKVKSKNEEFKTSCYFNSKRAVIQFGDPWDLRSDENSNILITIHNPSRTN